MNIAMISLYLPSETKMGVGYQAHAMANAFVARGHSVTMFSACAKADGARYDYQRVDVGNSLRTFRFAWNLRKIDFSGFDIIHAHGDNYWLWSRRNRPPVVRTMHGSCLVEAWKVPGVKEKLRMLLLYAAEVLATLVADKTVCVSTDTLRYYPGLRTVIPNGVNVAAFGGATGNEQRVPARREATTAGGIQRTTSPGVPGKELESVQSVKSVDQDSEPRTLNLEVNKESAALPGDAKCEMLNAQCSPSAALPGDAKCEMPNASRHAGAHTANTAHTEHTDNTDITLLGFRSDVSALMSACDIFVLPAPAEPFGLVLIEAMALGKPVIAAAAGGPLEIVADGETGLLFEPGNAESLSSAIRRLLADPDLRRRMGIAGRKRYAQKFTARRMAENMQQVYAGGQRGEL